MRHTALSLSKIVASYVKTKVDMPVYTKDTKDPKYIGEYVSVNCLGNENKHLSQAYVNVNIHVPDIAGVANTKRITELSEKLMPYIDDVYLDGVWLYLDSDSFSDDSDKTHYQNFKLLVINGNSSI